jgi:trigger factor
MQIKKTHSNPTTVQLAITADTDEMNRIKTEVLTRLSKGNVKLAGFRKGKAPLALVEKQVEPGVLQSEFLESAINQLYTDAAIQENIRPVAQPEVSITKFVPFSTLEFVATVEAVGEVKLPDYKKIKLAKKPVKVGADDIKAVLDDLKTRVAEKKEVARAAKNGDEVLIDFKGVDAKTKEPIAGADGSGYPLQLGSNTFIPGFEDNVVGMKPGETKSFDLKFPEDYGVKALQSRNVNFEVTASKVQEVIDPKLDDAFAAKVGPFKTLQELKDDIKRQLTAEREQQNDAEYQNELLQKVAEKAQVDVPKSLVDEEIERQEQRERQNLAYRGQTWEEHLKEEGVTAEEHRENNRAAAEMNVRAGLVLSELADAEGIQVTPEELDIRMQLLKGQYTDPAMQAELAKPESRRDIMSRLMTEKTIAKLTEYALAK